MCYFSGVGGVNFYQVFALALFCDKALTGETLHSVESMLLKFIKVSFHFSFQKTV